MEVNGRKVDTLAWLRDTGGRNAINRLSTKTDVPSSIRQNKKDSLSLTPEALATMKQQLQYNRLAQLPPTAGTILAPSNPLSDLPPFAQEIVAETNLVRFNRDDASANSVSADGEKNVVDFSASNREARANNVAISGNSNFIRGYNGGQKNNSLTITGSENRIYVGEGASSNSVSLMGSANTASLGTGNAQNNVVIVGSNVKVNLSQSGGGNWSVSVKASNLEVDVVNGKASVALTEAQKNTYRVLVDNDRRTVVVEPIPLI